MQFLRLIHKLFFVFFYMKVLVMCFYPRKTTTFGNIHNYIGLVVPKAVFGHILSYMLHAVPNRESNPLLTERKVLLYEN